MTFTLDKTSIQIFEKEHNPTILSKEWLSKKKIIQENEIKNFAHTPVFSLIETEYLGLLVKYEMLDMSIKKTDSECIKKSLWV